MALGMLVRAARVETRCELAWSLNMSELAAFLGAIGSIPAERHAGVLEVTMRVGAVGEESAELLRLMCRLNGRRGMATGTLAVLTSSPVGANI